MSMVTLPKFLSINTSGKVKNIKWKQPIFLSLMKNGCTEASVCIIYKHSAMVNKNKCPLINKLVLGQMFTQKIGYEWCCGVQIYAVPGSAHVPFRMYHCFFFFFFTIYNGILMGHALDSIKGWKLKFFKILGCIQCSPELEFNMNHSVKEKKGTDVSACQIHYLIFLKEVIKT